MAEALSRDEVTPPGYQRLLTNASVTPEHRLERQRWWSTVSLANKRQALFELEVLLKASACFANPRNHPGRTSRAPVNARDFHITLELFDQTSVRVGELCSKLLGQHDQRVVFQRYLETTLTDDLQRARMMVAPARPSPELELARLRRSFAHMHEVISGALRAPRVNYRLFYSLLSLARQEVEHSCYFDSLRALEFRAETDIIEVPQIVAALERAPAGPPQRLAAVTLLSMFRLERLVGLLRQMVTRDLPTMPGCVFAALSVLRSEARALCRYLLTGSAPLLRAGFDQRLLHPFDSSAPLQRLGRELVDFRRALESLAWSLRLEVRLVFDLFLASPEDGPSAVGARSAVRQMETRIGPFLRNEVAVLAGSMPGNPTHVSDDAWSRELEWVAASPQQLAESLLRLRRDCWVFCCVSEAFVGALPSSSLSDAWSSPSVEHFAREYLNYFRALGLPLARLTRYPDVETLVAALGELRIREPWGIGLVAKVVTQCRKFSEHLRVCFDQLNRSEHLAEYAFDASSTALEVKAYLGQAAKTTV